MRSILLLLFFSSPLIALPVGNPAQASLYKQGVFFDPCAVNPCNPLFMFVGALDFRIGYYGDAMWHREVGEFLFGTDLKAVAAARMKTSASYVVANIYQWMDVFGTFGVSQIDVTRTAVETRTRGVAVFSPSFSWSTGTHATLYRKGPFYIGGEGQYFRTQPDLDSYCSFASGEAIYFSNTNSNAWEEWQVGFGCALDLENELGTGFIPYAAIKFNQGKFVLRGFQFTYDGVEHQLPDLEPVNYFGWAFGWTWLLRQAMSVTCEGRWLNEKGVFINGQMRF